jgi:hypothetical protein
VIGCGAGKRGESGVRKEIVPRVIEKNSVETGQDRLGSQYVTFHVPLFFLSLFAAPVPLVICGCNFMSRCGSFCFNDNSG